MKFGTKVAALIGVFGTLAVAGVAAEQTTSAAQTEEAARGIPVHVVDSPLLYASADRDLRRLSLEAKMVEQNAAILGELQKLNARLAAKGGE